MAIFYGTNNKGLVIEIPDREEAKICPSCGMPNLSRTQTCEDCGYVLGINCKWIRAELIRQCPTCGAYLRGKESKCGKCGWTPAMPGDEEPHYVKICPNCRTKNTFEAKTCANCGQYIDEEEAVLNNSEEKDGNKEKGEGKKDSACDLPFVKVSFKEVRTGKTAEILLRQGEERLVGQWHDLSELLRGDNYVSREHFCLTLCGNVVFIQDASRNGTYINGGCLTRGQDYPLSGDTLVVLGDPSPDEKYAIGLLITY